jgi:hypothetical protein
MIGTRRRRNIVRAWQNGGGGWQTIAQLQAHGAYGSAVQIHRALMKMGARTEGWGKQRAFYLTRYLVSRLGFVPQAGAHIDEDAT